MEEKWKEFNEAVKAVQEWICKYGDPHTTVIVDLSNVDVTECIHGTPLIPPC